MTITERPNLSTADVIVVSGEKAWLFHDGVWSDIHGYADSVTALIATISRPHCNN